MDDRYSGGMTAPWAVSVSTPERAAMVRGSAGRAARPATPRDPAALPGELAERLAGVQDPDLRAALERMAQGVYRKR